MELEYDPAVHGAVVAIRLYLNNQCTPMADMKMAFGKECTIQWNDIDERAEYEKGITGYTLFYDERPKRSWNKQ
jgi:hypothetical protein